jgi:hypothetical protein
MHSNRSEASYYEVQNSTYVEATLSNAMFIKDDVEDHDYSGENELEASNCLKASLSFTIPDANSESNGLKEDYCCSKN